MATVDQLLFAGMLGLAILAVVGAATFIGWLLMPDRNPNQDKWLPPRVQGLNRGHPAAKSEDNR